MVEPKLKKFCSNDYFKEKCFSPQFSDVTIKIGKNVIHAHKIILAKNEVFNGMLTSNMLETRSNVLKIADCDVKTFKTFLEYLYTDKVADDKKTTNLLAVADKYLDTELKFLCESALCNDINVENSIDKLLTGIKYRCYELKGKTCRFIVKYYDKVRESRDFELMISNRDCITAVTDHFNYQIKSKFFLHCSEKLIYIIVKI